MDVPCPNPRVARPTFGRDLLAALPRELFPGAVVYTQPEPWALVREAFPRDTRVVFVDSMEHARVRERAAAAATAPAVFGVGGGSALDQAKYTAWGSAARLVLVPTILSVDAAFTKAVGVREGGRVRYVGEVFSEYLLVDTDLVRAAPPDLNRAGLGDLLSIFTALWDWQEVGAAGGEPYFPEIAAASAALLERLLAAPAELRNVTDAGLRLLAEGFVEEVRLCEMVGTSRPEEGSEHYLAYALEARTGRAYLHGRLVALCVLLAGAAQGRDVSPLRRFLDDAGLDWRPAAVGTTRDELRAVLGSIGDYVAAEPQLLPGIFHRRGNLPPAEAEAVLDAALGQAP